MIISERHIQFIVRAYGMRRTPSAPACCVVLLKIQARRISMLPDDTECSRMLYGPSENPGSKNFDAAG